MKIINIVIKRIRIFTSVRPKRVPLSYVLGGMTVLVIAALSIYAGALGGVYAAAVYQYAEGGSPMRGFDRSLLDNAFRHKK